MNRKSKRHDGDTDRAIAKLIEETDWSDVAKRLLLYVLHLLSRGGTLSAGRHAKAKSYVEQAVGQFLENQHELTLVTQQTLFGCLCVIADCLVRDDAEDARKRAWRSVSAASTTRLSLFEKKERRKP